MQLRIGLLLTIITLAACTDYGKKVSHEHVEVFYKNGASGITESQAQQTAVLIHSLDQVNQNKAKKSMQLERVNDTVVFRMVVVEEKLASVGDEPFVEIANLLSAEVFNNEPVNIDFTDNRFNIIRSLRFRPITTE